MTTPIDIFDADLAAQQTSAVNALQSITWRNVVYPCLITDLSMTNALADEGFMINADIQCTLRTAQFSGDRPKGNDIIIYRSERYRVAPRGVVTSYDDVAINLYLVTEQN